MKELIEKIIKDISERPSNYYVENYSIGHKLLGTVFECKYYINNLNEFIYSYYFCGERVNNGFNLFDKMNKLYKSQNSSKQEEIAKYFENL
jgi:hypothetical protein